MSAHISVTLLLSTALLFAQQIAPPANLPPPPAQATVGSADMSLVFAYFRFQLGIADEIDRRGGPMASSASGLHQAASNLLGLSPSDFSKVTKTGRDVMAAIQQIDSEAQHYDHNVASQGYRPDPLQLQQFQAKRETALRAGMDQIRSALSPAGAAAFTSFLDHSFEGRFVKRLSAIPAKQLSP